MNATMTMPNGGLPQAAAAFSHSNEQILRVEDLTVSFDGFKACLLYTSPSPRDS